VFDNEEFDCRTPREWLNMGLDPESQNRKPVPGKALLPTDDFLGHGEQGQPRMGSCLFPVAVLAGIPGLLWQGFLGSPGTWLPWEVRGLLRLPSWTPGQRAGHIEAGTRDGVVEKAGKQDS
jgi:hypothetical protein